MQEGSQSTMLGLELAEASFQPSGESFGIKESCQGGLRLEDR